MNARSRRIVRRFSRALLAYIALFALVFLYGYVQQRDENANNQAEESMLRKIAANQWREVDSKLTYMTGMPATNNAGD